MVLASEAGQTTGRPGFNAGAASREPGSIAKLVGRSGWLPVVLAVALTVLELSFFGVPVATTGAFLGYLILFITLPGVLLWRLANRRSGAFVEVVAAGTALGYAIEVLTYIPARAVGLPLLTMVLPLATIVAFLAVPELRRYWRANGVDGQPSLGWSWTLAATWVMVLFWSAKYFRYHGIHWPSYGAPDMDMPFHLALLGEAKHHIPLMTPWISDEPVLYHWFVYAEMASTSWVTGIEPTVLLTRLSLLPMLAAFAVLISTITRRLTGSWWIGATAVIITFFVLAPNPYGWHLLGVFTHFGFSPIDDGSSFRLILWTSPTQTFGALLFAPVVLTLIDLLDGPHRNRRQWAIFVVLLVAVMGAKATYLPILLGALVFTVAVQLAARRRVHRPLLGAAAVTFLCLLFAQFVLFGGASQGLKFEPLSIMKASAAPVTTGFTADPRPWRLILIAVVTVFCWLCIWGGVIGLRRRLLEPEMLLLLGLGLAGMGGILVLGQSGGSQGFFLQSARPYLAIAAACGLAALVPRMNRRRGLALLAAVAGGAVIARIVQALGDPAVPVLTRTHGAKRLAFDLIWPYALLFGFVGFVVVGLWLLRRRVATGTAVALVVCVAAGFGLRPTYVQLSTLFRLGNSQGWREVSLMAPFVTAGTMEAGRWLRDHSSADDLVATNAHCLYLTGPQTCFNLHFAIAGYTERRVLVEGWGFTATAHVEAAKRNTYVGYVPYWRPEVLADNDAAFTSPSASTVGKLRDSYRVRWLFVDETQGVPPDNLASLATLRYRSGPSAVYEVNP